MDNPDLQQPQEMGYSKQRDSILRHGVQAGTDDPCPTDVADRLWRHKGPMLFTSQCCIVGLSGRTLALMPCRILSSARTSTVSKGTERLWRMFTTVPL